MSKILILKVKAIKGSPSYDERGVLKSQHESFKVPYESLQWKHFLENMGYHGFGKVLIEGGHWVESMSATTSTSANDKDLEAPMLELKKAFAPKEKALTPEQKEISLLKKQIEEMQSAFSSSSEKKSPGRTPLSEELKALRAEYKDLAGKAGHKDWTEDDLKEKIAELKES